MPRRKVRRCQLAARLRSRRERTGRTRPRRFAYWRAPVRLCRGEAIAAVTFVGQARALDVCRECFDRESYEHPGDWLEFEMIEGAAASRSERRRRSTTLETRAPEERSDEAPPYRSLSMVEWRELEDAGLDPRAPREIGELLRERSRELCIPGASAPGADSGCTGSDHSEPRVTAVSVPTRVVADPCATARPLATESP